MFATIKKLSISLILGCGLAAPSHAQDPSALQIIDTKAGTEISLTLQELDALPQITFTTTTIWTDDAVMFQGPSLHDVLAASGTSGQKLTLTALNDYAIEMPAPENAASYPIVATRMNGQTMPVRGMGPFWIVYPYDSDLLYRSEEIYSRSIWQLDRIRVIN
jgi:hypothetical protein